MKLKEFVKGLPEDLVLSLCYRKGVLDWKDEPADGKQPITGFTKNAPSKTKAAALLAVENIPTIGSVGLWTGEKGKGIVILDVDANLASLKRKWGDALGEPPTITSTKANAAKYVYRVPEALWGGVAGFGNRGDGYECLWGVQGVVFGAYPGKPGISEPGEYSFTGDLNEIPEIPQFLLDEMQKQWNLRNRKRTRFFQAAAQLDFADRTPEQKVQMAKECLTVIGHEAPPAKNASAYQWWIQVGLMIHDEIPDEDGLELWSNWSKEDSNYSDEWDAGNDPCTKEWSKFKPGELKFGSLVHWADEIDPGRTRLSEESKKILEEMEANAWAPKHADLMERVQKIMDIDDPSEVQYKLHLLAQEIKCRDMGFLTSLLTAHEEYKSGAQGGFLKDIWKDDIEAFEYLIPGVIAKPSTLLFHGPGGSGKTMGVLTLAKHVCRGIPFKVKGAEVPVEKGRVLWLNGDQGPKRIMQQLSQCDFAPDDDFVLLNKVSMLWTPWFVRQMEKYRPKLVVFDSVTACMRGSAVDQNKAEYADPVYWYTGENGVMFPETTIIFIHHANKTGEFRGTTGLRDAVDEEWMIRKPKKEEMEKIGRSRPITIGKSREGNEGQRMLMVQRADLTFEINQVPEDGELEDAAASVFDGLLAAMRTAGRPMKRKEVLLLPIPGNKDAKAKTLQRAVGRGLVKRLGTNNLNYTYEAVQVKPRVPARATTPSSVSSVNGNTSDTNESELRTTEDMSSVFPQVSSEPLETCPQVSSVESQSTTQKQPTEDMRTPLVARNDDPTEQEVIDASMDQRTWDDKSS